MSIKNFQYFRICFCEIRHSSFDLLMLSLPAFSFFNFSLVTKFACSRVNLYNIFCCLHCPNTSLHPLNPPKEQKQKKNTVHLRHHTSIFNGRGCCWQQIYLKKAWAAELFLFAAFSSAHTKHIVEVHILIVLEIQGRGGDTGNGFKASVHSVLTLF